MMDSIISWAKYLKDPLLVSNFQRRFGIERDPLDNLVPVYDGSCKCDKIIEWDWATSVGKEEDGIKRRYTSRKVCDCDSKAKEGSSNEKTGLEKRPEANAVDQHVTNKFWYYLFVFGTALGDEVFYAAFFSFWFWNIDGAVGRRVALVWGLVMYIGQGLKDVICWPRPASPPVVRLEKKWELEYGMPSTHAMTGAAVPFSVLIFTWCRYEYPVVLMALLATLWCSLVCTSRIYLGMHSVLDIVAGLALVPMLFTWVIPLVDVLDPILLKDSFGAFYLLTGAVILAVCSPGGDRWTPARGDTVVILGSVAGMLTGAWINYQSGIISSAGPPIDFPFPIIWPSWKMFGYAILRMVIGLSIIGINRVIMKATTRAAFNSIIPPKPAAAYTDPAKHTRMTVFAELSQKFVTYFVLGASVTFLSPFAFRQLGIERATFHTEV